MALWTAFSIGLLGSLHCVGMCGPIALALPYSGRSHWALLGRILLYQFGRIITYAILGLLIGIIGKGVFLAGFQTQLSLALGILLLGAALFSINIESKLLRIPVINHLNSWTKKKIGYYLGKSSPGTFAVIGLLNGLLPCGLVYMAIVGAVGAGTIWHSSAYMILFGLGTLPLMLLTSLAGQFIKLKWRSLIRKLVPAFLLVFAVLFIIRGLNFDLPLDFFFWEEGQDIPFCH